MLITNEDGHVMARPEIQIDSIVAWHYSKKHSSSLLSDVEL